MLCATPMCRNLITGTTEYDYGCDSRCAGANHCLLVELSARLAPVKEQVIELRSAAFIQTDNLTIEHSLAITRRRDCFPKLSE